MKKRFPLTVLRNLNDLKSNVPEIAKLSKSDSGYFRYEDIDSNSDFFFEIMSYGKNNNGFYYAASYKPNSANDLGTAKENFFYSDLVKKIAEWSRTLQLFNETPYFDEDPITTSYTNEFFEEYKLLEDGANIEPFDLERQILIDRYLDASIKFLEKYEAENPDIDLSEPKEQAKKVKQILTESSKNEVIKALSKFWAISRKRGLPILRNVFFELAKEIVKELGKKMIGL